MEFKELSIEAVKYYYERNFCMKDIAKVFSISDETVSRFVKKNKIDLYKIEKIERTCKICNEIKPIEYFRFYISAKKKGAVKDYSSYCLSCDKVRHKKANKESAKKRKLKNIELGKARENLSNLTKEEKKLRKLAQKRKYYRNKIESNDIFFKLRKSVSGALYKSLFLFESKDYNSKIEFLPYTIAELKAHLESQFEPWQSWSNYGKYLLNGPLTWQIDHIIPQSKLPYTSFEDENFKKCWALENLRPLESRANLLKSNK